MLICQHLYDKNCKWPNSLWSGEASKPPQPTSRQTTFKKLFHQRSSISHQSLSSKIVIKNLQELSSPNYFIKNHQSLSSKIVIIKLLYIYKYILSSKYWKNDVSSFLRKVFAPVSNKSIISPSQWLIGILDQ